jgi:hypothetical protein
VSNTPLYVKAMLTYQVLVLDPLTVWLTNEYNEAHTNQYHKLVQSIESGKRKKKGGAVVLDLFSGIGTFLVALKQVGIKIKKVSADK